MQTRGIALSSSTSSEWGPETTKLTRRGARKSVVLRKT